jgi:hypothetical protein
MSWGAWKLSSYHKLMILLYLEDLSYDIRKLDLPQ